MDRLERIAHKVAKALFTSGVGEVAERLVLTSLDNRDLGGWGINPVRNLIHKALLEATAKAKRKRRVS